MIPKIAAMGRSFQGAFKYYGHDKHASTKERVAWTHTENMITTCPEKAIKVMAYTAIESERLKEASGIKATGRKLQKPVFSYSLAWHPEQSPDKEHMLEAALESVKALGVEDHEVLVIAHQDEPHKHCHIIVNRVHPITGVAAKMSNSRRKLSTFALSYERKHGKIYCLQREANHEKREKGEQTMYRDQHIQEAWNQSDSGKSFEKELEKRGYQLAIGRKRIVVIDPYGQAVNPNRHIGNAKASEVTKRLKEIPREQLSNADEVIASIQKSRMYRYRQRLHEGAKRSELLNDLQDRQHEEMAQLSRKHHLKIIEEDVESREYYQIKEQEEEVEKLTAQESKKGLVAQISNALIKTKEKLDVAKANLESARARYSQRIKAMENEKEEALKELKERQVKEWTELEKLIGRQMSLIGQTHTAPRPRRDHTRRQQYKGHEQELRLSR